MDQGRPATGHAQLPDRRYRGGEFPIILEAFALVLSLCGCLRCHFADGVPCPTSSISALAQQPSLWGKSPAARAAAATVPPCTGSVVDGVDGSFVLLRNMKGHQHVQLPAPIIVGKASESRMTMVTRAYAVDRQPHVSVPPYLAKNCT
jgi:hypothetical protein